MSEAAPTALGQTVKVTLSTPIARKRRRAREEGEEAIASLTKGLAVLDAQERGS